MPLSPFVLPGASFSNSAEATKYPRGGILMAKPTDSDKLEQEGFQTQRLQFAELLAANPNYFGNLENSVFKPVFPILKNTFYEQLTCLGFNPSTNVLEAVIQIKQASGYSGSLCQHGSFEYVRFFVDYGAGWEDAGVSAVNVHDISNATDCHKDSEKPLSYAASAQLTPKSNWCFFPVLPKVRAILSWNSIPTGPGYVPVWGNVFDAQIQIHPRPLFLKEIAANINDDVKLVLPPEELEHVLQIPIPIPDPPPLTIEELAKQYGLKGETVAAGKKAAAPGLAAENLVPSHRFGVAQLNQSLGATTVDAQLIELNIAQWKNAGLDWQSAVAQLLKTSADVSYEQLECVGLEGAYGLERLVANFVIKRPAGYGGPLCTAGSTEYVSFWADWDNTCKYVYLGTVGVNVHDIASIPAGGLVYSAVLPVNLSKHRSPCMEPKIGRVRAVLSWNVPPSTTNPDALTYWGNLVDAHVQIQPGDKPNYLEPKIAILGGIPTSMINGVTGLTTSTAVFALTNTTADSLGRACPFGGVVSVQGESFVGYKYKLTVKNTNGGATKVLTDPLTLTRWDGTTYVSSPDINDYFTYVDPTLNINALLGEWGSSGDDLWTVTLEIADLSDNPVFGAVPDTHLIQLDNTPPQAVIHLDNNLDCSRFGVGAVLNGHFVAYDIHFGSFSLYTEPFPGPVTPSSGTVPTAPLPSTGSAWSLNTATLAPCGYVVRLDVVDRSIVNSSPNGHNGASNSVGFCLLQNV
jgi:hypothetical protein